MLTIGFVLLVLGVLGALISIAFSNPLSWGCLVGEGIGFITVAIGFLLMLGGIACKLWEVIP